VPAWPLNDQIDLGLWSETPMELRWQTVLRMGPLAIPDSIYRPSRREAQTAPPING
jgi:hypothetical protein